MEFVKLLPKAVEAFDNSFSRWLPDDVNRDLASDLVAEFRDENEIYCELDAEGQVEYFFYLLRAKPDVFVFWIIYIHPCNRDKTRAYTDYLRERYRKMGISKIEFITTRLTSSYKRWAEKLGAKQFAITYVIDLTKEES